MNLLVRWENLTLFNNKYRIESTRLPNWDYASPGYYYITICTNSRKKLFGTIINGRMQLNEYGMIVQNCWNDLPNHYPGMKLDSFVIMPDHVHGIIQISEQRHGDMINQSRMGHLPGGADVDGVDTVDVVDVVDVVVETGLKPVSTKQPKQPKQQTRPNPTLSEIIRGFKTFSARKINVMRNTPGIPVWQSRFHDHIIRDERALFNIRTYIRKNPENLNPEGGFV